MNYFDYLDAVNIIKSLREDIRFSRDLNLIPIFENANIITKVIAKETNLLRVLQMLKHGIEDYEFTHPVNVAIIASMIGKWLNLPQDEIYQLACAGLLHDVGKGKIKDSLLTKESKLLDHEYELMKTHPIKGYEYIKDKAELTDACKMAVLSHHEREDGSGYPHNLKGNEIHLFAKILAVADIFDAMTSNRIYSNRSTIINAQKEIADGSFKSLDPKISQLFFKKLSECCIGSTVLLSNDIVGEIIHVSPIHPYQPLIRHDKGYCNLVTEVDVKVIDIL